jgi:hypothetical protein
VEQLVDELIDTAKQEAMLVTSPIFPDGFRAPTRPDFCCFSVT